MVVGESIVKRGEIQGIIHEWESVIYDYYRYKRYGDPYGRGWLYWPQHTIWYLDAIAEAECELQKVKNGGKG